MALFTDSQANEITLILQFLYGLIMSLISKNGLSDTQEYILSMQENLDRLE